MVLPVNFYRRRIKEPVIIGHPPAPPFFFFRLASHASPDIGSVGEIERKNKQKKSQEVSEEEALVPQDDVKS